MKTTQEMIAVMQAFADGKEVQQGSDKYGWFTAHAPSWDWSRCDYRVKAESQKLKNVPYNSAEDFITAQKEHGPYLVDNRTGSLACPTRPYWWGVDGVGIDAMTWEEIFEHCEWQDGTPCRKEVIE